MVFDNILALKYDYFALLSIASPLSNFFWATTLDIYTHLLKSADQAAADVMDEILLKGGK